jgi:hypothetical protein
MIFCEMIGEPPPTAILLNIVLLIILTEAAVDNWQFMIAF